MKFIIDVDVTNASLADSIDGVELSSIVNDGICELLNAIQETQEGTQPSGAFLPEIEEKPFPGVATLRDSNGNRVGSARIETIREELERIK